MIVIRSLGSSAPGLQEFDYENFGIDVLPAPPDGLIPLRSDPHRSNKAIGIAVSQSSPENAFDLTFSGTKAQEGLLPVSDRDPLSIRGEANPDHPTFSRLFTRADNVDDLIP